MYIKVNIMLIGHQIHNSKPLCI